MSSESTDLTAIYVIFPIIVIVAVLALCRFLAQRKWGRCTATQSLKGKNIVVTGANSGIGLETAKSLVTRGARVVFACRDVDGAKKVVGDIRRKQKKVAGEMIVMELDLASLDSIRSFVEVLKVAFDRIDVLINNAGVASPLELDKVTKDGFEINMGVNHLGHFLLTTLMLDLLKKGAPSRVVIVSSGLHENGELDFEDLNLTKARSLVKEGQLSKTVRTDPGYCNSKLMNIYFGKALAEKTKNMGIDVFTLCPGLCYTNIFRYSLKWYQLLMGVPFFFFVMKTAEQGAQTSLHCATEPSLQGTSGQYFENCRPSDIKTKYDKATEQKLWAASEAMVNAQQA